MNTADIATRGASPDQLQNSSILVLVHTCIVFKELSFEFERFLKYHKMVRVIGYILRFIYNCKQKGNTRLSGILSNEELDHSTKTLIKTRQRYSFPNEIQCLLNEKPLSRKSKILSLNPCLDAEDLIRVAGYRNRSVIIQKSSLHCSVLALTSLNFCLKESICVIYIVAHNYYLA